MNYKVFISTLIGAIVLIIVIIYSLYYSIYGGRENELAFIYRNVTIDDCLNGINNLSNREVVSYTNFCALKLHNQGLLDEQVIRRMVYDNQNTADRVLMWMVVLLTFSGVFLAGIQLFTTYRLTKEGMYSGEGQSQELIVSKDRVVVRSSVTGLLILIVSFAFFYVYIIYVYTIRDSNQTAKTLDEFVQIPVDGQLLDTDNFPTDDVVGGLGSPAAPGP